MGVLSAFEECVESVEECDGSAQECGLRLLEEDHNTRGVRYQEWPGMSVWIGRVAGE